ncbi:MAG: hypothetical protein QM719_02940 [Thermomonas sp.]
MIAMHSFRRFRHGALAVLAVVAGIGAATATRVAVADPQPILTSNQLLAQAAPDECFNGIGVDYPAINPDGTCTQGEPKYNESYIWGLTEQGGKLWFGTMANAACILDGMAGGQPMANGLFACEFGTGEFAREHPAIPAPLGDWRMPRIYSWDLATGELVNRLPGSSLLKNTLGFRGAGSIDDIAFLAGPSLSGASVNFFAFKASTGKLLGACTRTDYNYIRSWRLVDGVLYVGVGSSSKGGVLRWDGAPTPPSGNFCGRFSEVGRANSDVANLAMYVDGNGNHRLAASTVPIRSSSSNDGASVGVWISPPIPAGGLTTNEAGQWQEVWSPSQYDPDTIMARFGYSGGALQYFDGWLYWGTIHLQNSKALSVHENCNRSYCFGMPSNIEEAKELADGIYRSTSVWRGRNLEDAAHREIQLLYGESELPAVVAPKTFETKPTGWTPLYGPSGFGNRSNEYTWQMAVFDGRLYIGTFDASTLQGNTEQFGADLWRFDSSDSPAVNENYTGLGDRYNYGIRILHPLQDGSGLIAGMANPFNLATGGGWELRLLKEGAPAAKQSATGR